MPSLRNSLTQYPYLKKLALLAADASLAAYARLLRIFRYIDFPVPPAHVMRGTSSRTIRHYFESGLNTASPIYTATMEHGLSLYQPATVLDFGCGAGRQLLHFARNFKAIELHACDISYESIDYIQRAFPQVQAYTNNFDPPLKYDADTFDMIYSVSIFSHLEPRHKNDWLAELYRVTKPGGLVLPTILGRQALAVREAQGYPLDLKLIRNEMAEQGLSFIPNKPQAESQKQKLGRLAKGIGVTGDYGKIFYSPKFVEQHFGCCGFEVEAVIPGVIDHFQDLLVLRKPGNLT
jgi:SAM-dependent methyltransferase